MTLCQRHEDALEFALELRGFLRPTLTADADQTPLEIARTAIGLHATNLAGRASIEMLVTKACPLCFITAHNPARINFDDWIELAADEAQQQMRVIA
jgi:hypothetical protein